MALMVSRTAPRGADGRPRTVYRHNEIAACGRELHLKDVRRFVLEERSAKKRTVIALPRRCYWRARLNFGLGWRWSRRFGLWLGWRLGLGFLRRRRFRSLLFRLTAEKQRSHCHSSDKPLYAFHFLTSPYPSKSFY